jgi:formate dehydrogenase-N alpha subunit
MKFSRRKFLGLTGTGAAASMLGSLGLIPGTAEGFNGEFKLKGAKEIPTTCPFCGVGCGAIMAVRDGKIINIEGDPDHPISEGSLCSKGASMIQMSGNAMRLTKVKYRAPGSDRWEEKSWDWALGEIAGRIKATRDKHWIEKDEKGNLVNRTEAIASVGSVFLGSEEAYLLSKLMRSLGLVFMENEARLCVSSAIAANDETVGRGPMTNHWRDLGNSDCIMVAGGNAAETFPNAFKWVVKAKEKGAKLIHVDPRFTRTSAHADVFVRLRSGTDVAFFGGMIKYLVDDMEKNPDQYNLDYIREYTTAAFLIDPNFGFEDGLFTGFDASKKSYDTSTWKYQVGEIVEGKKGEEPKGGLPLMDGSLKDPNCAFQLLRKHFSRYTPEMVSAITGVPKETFLEACRTFCATGAKGKAGAVILSSGACEHSHGTQNVRCVGILQLLLGNFGVAGGGINGIAGAVNGLGCSLQGLVFHWLPGALPVPTAADQALDKYLERVTPPESKMPGAASAWMGRPKHFISLLKAWYGDNATPENDYGFHWLPKAGGNHSWIPLFNAMNDGKIKGLVSWAMNPAVSGPSSETTRKAMEKLEWLVVTDLWETETAAFWKRPGGRPADIKTEVFLLPAACSLEKEGSVTNSCRWMQWRYKGASPPGDARSDLWILTGLRNKLSELYGSQKGPNAEAITKMQWDYGDDPDVHRVAKEINGYDLKTGKLLENLTKLQKDGTTSAGDWLYCGSYNEEGNHAADRGTEDPTGMGLFPKWAWAWPLNRRIFYNRASVDLSGKPWDEKRPVIRWDEGVKKWIGDAPDHGAPPGKVYPFIMNWEGRGRIFGLKRREGPFPEHYEPFESPVKNILSSQQNNPTSMVFEEKLGTPEDYPILATTFRVTEHMHTGAVTRNLPWLNELMPAMFVEMSEELAAERGVQSGDEVSIRSARGHIKALALVTKRIKPFKVDGRVVHQVGMPWNWGFMGLATGDSANSLTPRVVDSNTMIPEFRAFLCDIKKAQGGN